ncbi:MAG: efflux RND transporter periplasmic adaptor subunit, partial [Bacteroidales bacterium]
PISGTVSKVAVEIGERVVGTSQMAGTELLRIANFDNMEVVVDVNENDIVRLSIGDSATVEVDAYPNEIFQGVVSQIANSAKNVSGPTEQITNFEVRVNLLPSSYSHLQRGNQSPFKPGMSATVSVISDKREGVVAIPLQAITTRIELLSDSVRASLKGGEVRQLIFVVDSQGVAQPREIKSGIQDLHYIEIEEGLAEGERIITAPYTAIVNKIKGGTKIKESSKKDNE